jgi:hypothetical protein
MNGVFHDAEKPRRHTFLPPSDGSDRRRRAGLDLLKVGYSVNLARLLMTMCKKELVARGIFVVVACVLLSISFVVSRHFVPQGLRQMITVEHQVRRVLWRAERETLRSGATVQKVPVMANPPLEIEGVSLSLRTIATYYKTFLTPKTSIEPQNFIFELSPVLNL